MTTEQKAALDRVRQYVEIADPGPSFYLSIGEVYKDGIRHSLKFDDLKVIVALIEAHDAEVRRAAIEGLLRWEGEPDWVMRLRIGHVEFGTIVFLNNQWGWATTCGLQQSGHTDTESEARAALVEAARKALMGEQS